MKDLEAEPLLGYRRPSSSSSSSCHIVQNLAKVVLCCVLVAGTYIGLYLLNQQNKITITATFDLVHRDVWHANEAISRGAVLNSALVRRVVVYHTRGAECQRFRQCVQLLRDMQIASNVSTGADIPFNFLIGGDGQTYEGRGWSRQSGVDDVLPSTALTVAFIGDYSVHAPSETMLRQAETLLAESVQHGRLCGDFRVYGVRYLAEAHNNGMALFGVLAQRWSQWDVLINVV